MLLHRLQHRRLQRNHQHLQHSPEDHQHLQRSPEARSASHAKRFGSQLLLSNVVQVCGSRPMYASSTTCVHLRTPSNPCRRRRAGFPADQRSQPWGLVPGQLTTTLRMKPCCNCRGPLRQLVSLMRAFTAHAKGSAVHQDGKTTCPMCRCYSAICIDGHSARAQPKQQSGTRPTQETDSQTAPWSASISVRPSVDHRALLQHSSSSTPGFGSCPTA